MRLDINNIHLTTHGTISIMIKLDKFTSIKYYEVSDKYEDTQQVLTSRHKKAHITAIVSRSDLVATRMRGHNLLLMVHVLVIYHGGVTVAPTPPHNDTCNQEVETGDKEDGGKHQINGP